MTPCALSCRIASRWKPLFTLGLLIALLANITAAHEAAPIDEQRASSETTDPGTAQATQLPWELRPYRVVLAHVLPHEVFPDAALRDQWLRALEQRVAGIVGQYWQTSFEAKPSSFVRDDTLEQLNQDDFTAQFPEREIDKVIVLSASSSPRLQIAAREWDRSSGRLGPVVRREVIDRRRLAAVAVETILEAFRPLAQIETAEGATAEIRARAGELLAPQSLSITFQPGDLLTPYFRYLDRDRELRSIQTVPWTYLRVDSIARSRMTGAIETAFPAALAGNRRRVEIVAIRERPTYPETTLQLATRRNPNRPLVGVRVRIYDQLPSEEVPTPQLTEAMTDRFGRIQIPRNPADPLERLVVHSGDAVLANVPFVPGIVPTTTLEVPDDSPRLQAEGRLAVIQGDLIDVVSRRTVMLARALSLARNDQWEEADRLLAEIERQPSIASFKSRVLAIRVPAVAEAQKLKDRAAEKRIITMCKELEDLVDRYLARDLVRDVTGEINDLRKAATSPRKAG